MPLGGKGQLIGCPLLYNVAMWLPVVFAVLLVIWVLVFYWPFTLTGLAVWAFVAWMRRTPAAPAPSYREPAQVRPKPEPARAVDYLPRWTASRRQDVRRELAQWQQAFDT